VETQAGARAQRDQENHEREQAQAVSVARLTEGS